MLQAVMLSMLTGIIFVQMRNLFQQFPDIAQLMLTRNLSVLLVGYSTISVVHLVGRAVNEKTTGLIETLLTTPLRLRDLVWGKALQIGLVGYSGGLIVALSNSVVLLFVVGDIGLLNQVAWYYWIFSFCVAPMIIVGLLNVIIVLSLIVPDVRVSLLPFSLFATLLIIVGSMYRSESIQGLLMCILFLLAIGCHALWWLYGNRISIERIITS